MPLEFLSDEEVAAYGRFSDELPAGDVERFFYLDDADRNLIARRRADHHRLGFVIWNRGGSVHHVRGEAWKSTGLRRGCDYLLLSITDEEKVSMRVQRVLMPGSGFESWTLLGDDHVPVEPVERFLAYLASIERSPNTVKAYAHDLKDWFAFLGGRAQDWRAVDVGGRRRVRGLAAAAAGGP